METLVEVSHEIPPIYPALQAKFGVEWDKGLIIAWNKKVHTKFELGAQKVIHELVHLREQERLGNEAWWRLYLENERFRLDQEVMAMREEIAFLKKYIKNREHRFHMVREVVHSLASGMYGIVCDKEQAWSLLK